MDEATTISGTFESDMMGFNERPSYLVGPGVIIVGADGLELRAARRRQSLCLPKVVVSRLAG